MMPSSSHRPPTIPPLKRQPLKLQPLKHQLLKPQPFKYRTLKHQPLTHQPLQLQPLELQPSKLQPLKQQPPLKLQPLALKRLKLQTSAARRLSREGPLPSASPSRFGQEEADKPSLYRKGDNVFLRPLIITERGNGELFNTGPGPYTIDEVLPYHFYKMERDGQMAVHHEARLNLRKQTLSSYTLTVCSSPSSDRELTSMMIKSQPVDKDDPPPRPPRENFQRTSSGIKREEKLRDRYETLAAEIKVVNPELVEQLDAFSGSKSHRLPASDGEGSDEDVRDGEFGTDSDYDTDLEMNEEEFLTPRHVKAEAKDLSGSLHYVRKCNEMGVIPNQYFLRHLEKEEFVMRYHGLGPKGARAISQPLHRNTRVTVLNLEGNDIGGEGTVEIARMLNENVYITEVNLSENGLGRVGAEALCKVLENQNKLVKLDVSGNNFTDSDGIYFGKMLETNFFLKQIRLAHNQFGDNAAIYFRDALCANDSLQLLDLSWNLFRGHGAVHIAGGLQENVGLRQLNLAMNGFGVEGSTAMGAALTYNRTLKELDLTRNRITVDGVVMIARGMHDNDGLEVLRMGLNPLTQPGAYCLLSGIYSNEQSALNVLDIKGVYVTKDFSDLKDKVKQEKLLEVRHGKVDYEVNIRVHKKTKKMHLMEKVLNDPMTKLKNYVKESGLRMIDLFKQFDKDQTMALSYDELKNGLLSTGLKFSEFELDYICEYLDKDGEGGISFESVVHGDKNYRKGKRGVMQDLKDMGEKFTTDDWGERIHQEVIQDSQARHALQVVQETMDFFKLPLPF